jgi:hypothetical protein
LKTDLDKPFCGGAFLIGFLATTGGLTAGLALGLTVVFLGVAALAGAADFFGEGRAGSAVLPVELRILAAAGDPADTDILSAAADVLSAGPAAACTVVHHPYPRC